MIAKPVTGGMGLSALLGSFDQALARMEQPRV